jgi:hypothetical protein
MFKKVTESFVFKPKVDTYKLVGINVWQENKFYSTKLPDNSFSSFNNATLFYDKIFLDERIGPTTYPPLNPKLMKHVQKYLKWDPVFVTKYQRYALQEWSPIFSDWVWAPLVQIIEEEQPLGQRDVLIQIFQKCPKYSYGYFAAEALAPFKNVVGSFASATIGEFFASQAQWLAEEYCDDLNALMSELETNYWDNRKSLFEYLAGKSFTKRMRQLGVSRVAKVWDGKKKPSIEPGEASEEKQMEEALKLIEEAAGRMDAQALNEFSLLVYEQLISRGRAKKE